MTQTTNRTGRLFALFLLLLMGAFLWFLAYAHRFYQGSRASIEAAAQTAPLSKERALARLELPALPALEVKYRKFFITYPGAKQVELRGDFNRWGKDPIVLTPYKKGYFETSVALAAGEYQYEFVADGKPLPDPSNRDRRTLSDGREICIKTVR